MKHLFILCILTFATIVVLASQRPPVVSDVEIEADDTLIIFRDTLHSDTIFFNNGQPIPARVMTETSDQTN